MEDLYFENELFNIEKREIEDQLENYIIINFNMEGQISETTKEIYKRFDDILYSYYERKFGNNIDYNKIDEIIENFDKELTDDKLKENYENYEFSQEEKEYIKLVQISSNWRGHRSFNYKGKYAVTDILLRKKIMEKFDKEAIDTFKDIMQNELAKSTEYRNTVNYYMQLLSDIPYEEEIHTKLEEEIKKSAKYYFNQKINCGGYALKIDECVYPTYQENFDKSISSILNRFPFVRLLGDKPLEDDEYIVIYRAPKGKNSGHHFIRVDSDGSVREKDGSGQPRMFEDWGNLKDSEEAIFAVKKEHKMFGYKNDDINVDYKEGLDFAETVEETIKQKKNDFSYHNHNFHLKKSKQDEIVVISDNDEFIAQVVADESDCLVEISNDKEKYVSNTSSSVTPIIRNGKLINLEDFKNTKTRTESFEGR